MANFPPELIHLIVGNVQDRKDIHSCCLSASIFRYPCQQQLFQCLRISEPEMHCRRRYGDRSSLEVAVFFGTHPYLAKHVTYLQIFLKLATSKAGIEQINLHLQEALGYLEKVQIFSLNLDQDSWAQLTTSRTINHLLHWLESLPLLHHINLQNIKDLPTLDLRLLCNVASSVDFFCVELGTENHAENSIHWLQMSRLRADSSASSSSSTPSASTMITTRPSRTSRSVFSMVFVPSSSLSDSFQAILKKNTSATGNEFKSFFEPNAHARRKVLTGGMRHAVSYAKTTERGLVRLFSIVLLRLADR
uniref:F-box domain-containing protein n=1 Tax=Mycena chlorophos TaxID=658473 RepID=A0ABQ0LBZ9_MYCCL|nr:predicted protein [Mycena chlorophos]